MIAHESLVGGDEHAFDITSVVEAEEEFAGSVFGSLDFGGFEAVKGVGGGKAFPQRGRQIGHLGVAGDPFLKDPFLDLFGTVRLLPGGGEGGGEFLRQQAGQGGGSGGAGRRFRHHEGIVGANSEL